MRSIRICTTRQLFGDQIEKNDMGGACSTYVGENSCMQILVGISKGRRQTGRIRRRWENNIKIDLQDPGWETQTGLICLRIETCSWHL